MRPRCVKKSENKEKAPCLVGITLTGHGCLLFSCMQETSTLPGPAALRSNGIYKMKRCEYNTFNSEFQIQILVYPIRTPQ